MYKDIVGSDTGLAAVQSLSPCESFCGNSYVGCLVNNARTLSSKLQNHRCEVLCSSSHYGLCKCRASCKEDHVPAEIQQGSVHVPVTLNHCNVLLVKCFRNHVLYHLGYIRNIWRWLQHGSAAR